MCVCVCVVFLFLVSFFTLVYFCFSCLNVKHVSISVLRDISERGRDLEQVLSQYITFVKPAFEEFCLPVSAPVLLRH